MRARSPSRFILVAVIFACIALSNAGDVVDRSFQYADAFQDSKGTYTNVTCQTKNAAFRTGAGCVCLYGNSYSTTTGECVKDSVHTQGCDTRFLAPGDSAIQLRATSGLELGVEMNYCGGAWCQDKYDGCSIVSAFYDDGGWKQLWTNESHQQDFTVEVKSDKAAKLRLVGRNCARNAYNGMLLKFNFLCDVRIEPNRVNRHETCGLLRIVGSFAAVMSDHLS